MMPPKPPVNDPWADTVPPMPPPSVNGNQPAQDPPVREPDLVFRTLSDIAADVDSRPPRPWLFQSVIVHGDYGVLSAEDKAGKTWAMLDASVSCAAGLPWMGAYPSGAPGPVVVCFGEGSDAKFVRRVRAVAASKGLDQAAADALPIVACFRVPQLADPQHRHLLRRAIEQHKPSLVIVDPLYLAAGGANGADLYSMGALLGGIQHIAQEAGASLLISHHWNKTGTGKGHHRSSGVGPGAWGRFLISVGVLNSRTDPDTQETTVRLQWEFKGDEIPETEAVFVRRVRADNPTDLSSPLHYSIEQSNEEAPADTKSGDRIPPSERKLLEALQTTDHAQTIKELVDRIANKHGHGLRRETCSKGLNHLFDLGLADRIDPPHSGAPTQWLCTEKGAAHKP